MNEDRATRYHRLHRRAFLPWAVPCLAAGWWLIVDGGSRALRDVAVALTGAHPAAPATVASYTLGLLLAYHAIVLPLAFYQGFLLERRYGLSAVAFSTWLLDFAKGAAVMTLLAVGGTVVVYTAMRWWPRGWWLVSAACFAIALAGLAKLLPVVILPLFYRLELLDRDALRNRLLSLCTRAGIPAPAVYVWHLGDKSRRVNAALVGVGSTRRILLSNTLLADFSDDEIEVILAHEIGHHVHADLGMALIVEFVRITAAFALGAAVIGTAWVRFGLRGPADIAGLPLLLSAGLLASFATGPLLKALSRRNERRADEFALTLTAQPAAFVSAMRRLASLNLAEERPSRAAVWFFHTHPPVEQRIESARSYLGR